MENVNYLFIYDKGEGHHGMRCTLLEQGENESIVVNHRTGTKLRLKNEFIKTIEQIRVIEGR